MMYVCPKCGWDSMEWDKQAQAMVCRHYSCRFTVDIPNQEDVPDARTIKAVLRSDTAKLLSIQSRSRLKLLAYTLGTILAYRVLAHDDLDFCILLLTGIAVCQFIKFFREW